MRIYDIVDTAFGSTKNITGTLGAINIQPISRDMLRRSNLAGENSLGLGPEDGDLLGMFSLCLPSHYLLVFFQPIRYNYSSFDAPSFTNRLMFAGA